MSNPTEPMTPPPDYDDVMSGKENPPSYESQTLTSLNNAITVQPRYTPNIESQTNRPMQQTSENDYENGLGCEPFYDPATNNCLVCLFCNIFCHPITCLVLSCEDCCCDETDDRDRNRSNRAQRRNGNDHAVEACYFGTANGDGYGDSFGYTSGDDMRRDTGDGDNILNCGVNNDGDNSAGNDGGGNCGGFSGGGDCGGGDTGGDCGGGDTGGDCGGGDTGGDCGGSCD